MKFLETPLAGAKLVEIEAHVDERGSFMRLHCEREFDRAGLSPRVVQSNLSLTRHRGTVRGMHFQVPPSHEAKLVRCITGAICDVIVDLRPRSTTFLRHFAVELSGSTKLGLFVPAGFAHGFQTLEDDATVLYQMTDYHEPALAHGFRWNDAAFGISWPLPVTSMNVRDASYANFDPVLVHAFE